MTITDEQADRAWGLVLGSAAGDALGSQYEFKASHPDDWTPVFGVGVFGHAVGEWTDDTSMAIPILEWASSKGELPLRHILERWIDWSRTSKDVGIQTKTVLMRLKESYPELERHATREAKNVYDFSGKSAGNGSLMRIGPYALANLEEELDIATLSQIVKWTHYEESNVVACALWVDAIRSAILTGRFSMEESLERINPAEKDEWAKIIEKAQAPNSHPRDYEGNNGWVVAAFGAALSAVTHSDSLEDALYLAIRGGGDTDTVAAITGSLAGAVYGAEAIPEDWLELLQGWPGYSLDELQALTLRAIF